MATAVLTLPLGSQEDVLLIRRRARDLAALLQFTPEDQISLSTAVWEVARLAERRGEAELAVVESPPTVAVRVTVSGVPERFVRGEGGHGLDLQALGRLVQHVEAHDSRNGTAVAEVDGSGKPVSWRHLPGTDAAGVPLVTVPISGTVYDAVDVMLDGCASLVAVVDEEGRAQGVLHWNDLVGGLRTRGREA